MSFGRLPGLSAVLVAGALQVFTALSAWAETYSLAGSHSTVVVSWSHAGLSRHSARLVGFEGTLTFDPASVETSTVEAKLQPSRLSSGVAALDRLLRGPDFFNVAEHPDIRFRSTGITVTGERQGVVMGDLTILGVTKPVTLDVTWNFKGEHPLGLVNPSFAGKFVAGFSARTKLLRSEWGLGRGAPLISDEVEIAIEVEAERR